VNRLSSEAWLSRDDAMSETTAMIAAGMFRLVISEV
jgi:hypothetical protein